MVHLLGLLRECKLWEDLARTLSTFGALRFFLTNMPHGSRLPVRSFLQTQLGAAGVSRPRVVSHCEQSSTNYHILHHPLPDQSGIAPAQRSGVLPSLGHCTSTLLEHGGDTRAITASWVLVLNTFKTTRFRVCVCVCRRAPSSETSSSS